MLTLLVAVSVLSASLAQFQPPPAVPSYNCQEMGEYCNRDGGFPYCCGGMQCDRQTERCRFSGSNGQCAERYQSCDRLRCCIGMACQYMNGRRQCVPGNGLFPDNGGQLQCAMDGEFCGQNRYCCRNSMINLRCDNGRCRRDFMPGK